MRLKIRIDLQWPPHALGRPLLVGADRVAALERELLDAEEAALVARSEPGAEQ